MYGIEEVIRETEERYDFEIRKDIVPEIESLFDEIRDAYYDAEETEITRETGLGFLSEDEKELIRELEIVKDNDDAKTLEELIEEISEGYCEIRDRIKEKIELFFDENNEETEVAKRCIEALTRDEWDDIDDILEFVKDEDGVEPECLDGDGDDCSCVVKEMTYEVWSGCDENGCLVLYAKVKYAYYSRIDCVDSVDISKEQFERCKAEYAANRRRAEYLQNSRDEVSEDDEEYVNDEYGVPMHHIGDGVYCDDEGDNWEF